MRSYGWGGLQLRNGEGRDLTLPGIFNWHPEVLSPSSQATGRVKAQSILALRLHELGPELGLELAQGNPTL